MLPMLNIAVCDEAAAVMDALRVLITRVTRRGEFDARILMASSQSERRRLVELADLVHIALVSAERAFDVASELVAQNPLCLILLYSEHEVALEPLLEARPIAYHPLDKGLDALEDKLETLCKRTLENRHLLRCKSKSDLVLIPYTSVAYLESRGKYVFVHTRAGRVYSLFGKLTDVANEAPRRLFCRIHQSYNVNVKFIEHVDRHAKTITLSGGEVLPISAAHLKEAREVFESPME